MMCPSRDGPLDLTVISILDRIIYGGLVTKATPTTGGRKKCTKGNLIAVFFGPCSCNVVVTPTYRTNRENPYQSRAFGSIDIAFYYVLTSNNNPTVLIHLYINKNKNSRIKTVYRNIDWLISFVNQFGSKNRWQKSSFCTCCFVSFPSLSTWEYVFKQKPEHLLLIIFVGMSRGRDGRVDENKLKASLYIIRSQ